MPVQIIKKLLLVLDASSPSKAATDFALGLAKQIPCSLIAAFVIDTTMITDLLDMRVLIQEEMDDFIDDLEIQGDSILDDIKRRCEELEIELDDALHCRGKLNLATLQAQKQFGADAIVIGGWKESCRHKDEASAARALVLDQATCPVFVIKD